MYQKDFVLFVIEQFARILRKILAQILGGDHADAEFQIEQIYRQYLGLNSDLIHAFSFGYLMQLQKTDPEHYADRCLVLAEVLKLDAILFRERGQFRQSFLRGLKSLNVFLTLYEQHPTTVADRLEEVDAWATELEELLGRGIDKPPAEMEGLGFSTETVERVRRLRSAR